MSFFPAVRRWNDDKPHRCPACGAIIVNGRIGRRRRFLPDRHTASSAAVYRCCNCRVMFARWPRLALFLPLRMCDEIKSGRCPNTIRAAKDHRSP